MQKDTNFWNKMIDRVKKGFETKKKPSRVGADYEIKYDDSIEELVALGYANEMGVVINRDKYNLYAKVVAERRNIRNMPEFEELKKRGIVGEKGEVLDIKKFKEFKQMQMNMLLSERMAKECA